MKSSFAFYKRNFATLMLITFTLTAGLFSCKTGGGNNQGEPCKVCLDEKQDTTAFSNQLNAINHFVSVDSALVWTRNFQNQYQSIIDGKHIGDTAFLPITETFNLKIVDSIIAQPSTIGLRIYLGLKSDNKVHVILAGVDANGRDAIRDALGQNTGNNNGTTMLRFAAPPPPGKVYLGEDAQRHP